MIEAIDESVYILNTINSQVQDTLSSIVSISLEYGLKEKDASTLMHSTMTLGLIQCSSFIDELYNYFLKVLKIEMEQQYSTGLNKVLRIPRHEISKRFPDIKDLRNHYLAHNMRENSNKFKNPALNGNLRRYRVPQNLDDYRYLLTCLDLINSVINLEFPNSNHLAHEQISANTIPFLSPQFENSDGCQEAINQTIKIVNDQYRSFKTEGPNSDPLQS